MAVETVAVFFAASIALGLAPGPDNIFVLTQSALHGRKAGLIVTLGLCTGLLVHTTAVSFGVAAVFQASNLAFNTLKALGVLYLLYLAWQTFGAQVARLGEAVTTRPSFRALYLRGMVMNITNPKVAVFFLAFLPQFADPNLGPVGPQMLTLGGVFILATVFVFGCIAWCSGFVSDWLRCSARGQLVMNRIVGAVLLGLAIKLAFIEQ